MKRALVLPAVALALSFALVGCGGDDEPPADASSGGTTSGSPADPTDAATTDGADDTDEGDGALTKDEFLEQANAICAEGNAANEAAAEGLDQNDPAAVSAYLEFVVTNVRGQLTDIRALGIPADEVEEVGAIFDDADEVLTRAEADPDILMSSAGFDDVNAALVDYGLTECGS